MLIICSFCVSWAKEILIGTTTKLWGFFQRCSFASNFYEAVNSNLGHLPLTKKK